MDDLIVEFLAETNESLEELDADIIILEQNPNDADLIGKIFRLMHTVKGTCGFLGLPKLEKVAHHAENVLGKFRDGDLEVTADYVTLILESIDRIKVIVDSIQDTGAEPDEDNMDLIEKLDIVYEGRDKAAAADAPAEEAAAAEDAPAEDAPKTPDLDGEIDFTPVKAESFVEAAPAEEAVAPEPESVPAPEPTPPPAAPAADAAPVVKKEVAAPTQTLRVNVDVLEGLMTMVSELVLTRNQLMQISRNQSDNEFATPLQRLNHVVSELQEGVMKTRMQPIGNAWNKLPRIIRDLAMELNKKIDLQMRGQDTELDRQVLELIKDPLTHMVRNSADHGIETPEDRLAAGKKEMGTVVLDAFHEGGHIIIQIKDDGKGLPLEKIKTKILEKGLATAEELETMGAQQINQFIFHAGFSTAEQVTAVSGRGVGMDVVRTNIEKIGGSIELKSIEGQGSTFTIKIPLTLAIVSALIVEAGGEKFAIPQLSVRELVMASANSDNRIETIKGAPVFRLRNHLLPLVFLGDMLNLSKDKLVDKIEDAQDVIEDEDLDGAEAIEEQNNTHPDLDSKNHYIVVTQVGVYNFGIIVDKVFDTEEIVVKPVSKILKDLELFSGNTILGDGTVIMILDPNGIAKATGDIETAENKDLAAAEDTLVATSDKKTSLLLFAAHDETPKAVPLSLVARLEQVKMDRIEHSGGKMMVQYRDELMPLQLFNESMSLEGAREKPVLVFADRGQSLGIIVDEIIDIKEVHINVQIAGNAPSLMGSAIIDGKATDVVDINHFILGNNKKWFQNHDDTAFEAGVSDSESAPKKILLVDDSPFFRNMLTPILSVAGYSVTSLESPFAALEHCEKGERYDMIISDIEMPDMNGFEFAQKVKDETSWQDTPMVALSSHATQEDIDHGLEVGFQDYVAKFDRDILLTTISKTLMKQSKGVAA